MTIRSQRPILWLIAIAIGLILGLLEIFVPALFWSAWNLLIFCFGVFLALLILGARDRVMIALLALAGGIGVHIIEIHQQVSAGDCAVSDAIGWIDWIKAADRCVDYSRTWVFHAQAACIAGSLVLAHEVGNWVRAVLRWRRRA